MLYNIHTELTENLALQQLSCFIYEQWQYHKMTTRWQQSPVIEITCRYMLWPLEGDKYQHMTCLWKHA